MKLRLEYFVYSTVVEEESPPFWRTPAKSILTALDDILAANSFAAEAPGWPGASCLPAPVPATLPGKRTVGRVLRAGQQFRQCCRRGLGAGE